MIRQVAGCLLFLIAAMAPPEVFALGADFSKAQLAVVGKHCVHGFWVNEQTVTFFAGDTARLNDDLSKALEGDYASRKVVLHVGTKRAASPWDTEPRTTMADWSVETRDDPADAAKATPRFVLQIDVWLSSTIRLEELRIPKEFEVVSGGEIDQFIRQLKSEND